QLLLSSILLFFFCVDCYVDHPDLHSFPTRRSSDLGCLKQWEQFVNTRGRMPELVQCALMHEHFEAIHPFLDGNGRVGRLLIPLLDRKSTRLNSSHDQISYAVFCLKKKKKNKTTKPQ